MGVIHDKLERIQQEDRRVADVQTAYEFFDLGNYAGSSSAADGADANILRDLTERRESTAIGKSTLTRKLVSEKTQDLGSWARDDRSFTFYDPSVAEGQDGRSFPELERCERIIRDHITDRNKQRWFQQLLLTGYNVVSCGLADYFFVPESRCVTTDYKGDRFVYFDRHIDPQMLASVMLEAGSWMVDDGEAPRPFTIEDAEGLGASVEPGRDMSEIPIVHGQYRPWHGEFERLDEIVRRTFADPDDPDTYDMPEDVWLEFVAYGGRVFFRVTDVPVMHCAYFRTHPSTGEPQGVYSLIQAEEKSAWRIAQALGSRYSLLIDAAALVNASTTAEDIEGFSSGTFQTFSPDSLRDPGGPIRDQIEWIPTKAEEIPHLISAIEMEMTEARRLTGLHRRPTEAVTNTATTAHEAQLNFESATQTERDVMSTFLRIFAECAKYIALRDLSKIVEIDIRQNPIDLRVRAQFVERMFPQTLEMMKQDPNGLTFQGLVGPHTAKEMLAEMLESSGLPATRFLGVPTMTQEEYRQAVAQRQRDMDAQQKDAAVIAAEAEVAKAEAERIKGEAMLGENEVKLLNIEAIQGIEATKALASILRDLKDIGAAGVEKVLNETEIVDGAGDAPSSEKTRTKVETPDAFDPAIRALLLEVAQKLQGETA